MINLLDDPTCSMPIHGMPLRIPMSHSLPVYLKKFPLYDGLPRRISDYIHHKYGYLSCIDVGANIGDTIASFYANKTDLFLAIEPNPSFGKLLSENWINNPNVTIVSDICSSGSDEGKFRIDEKNGTASILQTENGITMRRRPLDLIVCDYPLSADANVLKVDTDGHDFEVIEGAIKLISKNRPFILFECDSFGNSDYVRSCLAALDLISKCGYKCFLLYDNFGNLLGKYSLSDVSHFGNMLFYQLTSNFNYFDVLVIKDDDMFEFHKQEISFFVGQMPDKAYQQSAIIAANL